MLTQRFFL